MTNYLTNRFLSIFLIFQILLVGFVSQKPEWIEKYYAKGMYPYISGFLRGLWGWLPISMGDILYLLLAFIILRWVWLLIKTHATPFRMHLYTFGAFLSILFFLFHLFWGFNYYRKPLQQTLGIEKLTYTPKELLVTTRKHIQKLNQIHRLVEENDSTPVIIPYKRKQIYEIASLEYKNLIYNHIPLNFKQKSIKSSLLSTPLTYMGFSGYLNPFTGEAQVNKKIPRSSYPASCSHELAHQLGYASEGEASYIGYLACMQSEDIYFRFSGEMLSVQHLLFSLARYDKELYKEVFAELHFGVRENIRMNRDFWSSYQNPMKPFFKKFYNLFLKVNRQKKGIQTYNEMVGYLVNSNTVSYDK